MMQAKFKLVNVNLAFWVCFLCVSTYVWGQNLEGSDVPRWVVGDIWDVGTILYSRDWGLAFSDPKMEERKHKPHVLARYTVKIEVTAERKHRGVECWQIDFTPDEKAPLSVREQKYRILVSKEDGSIIELSCLSGENFGDPTPKDVDGITVIYDAPYGFPLEIIPWTTNKVAGVNKTFLTATRNETIVGNEKHIELVVRQGTNEVPRIKQKWAVGAKWWSEYEKYTAGHIELHAKIIGSTSRQITNQTVGGAQGD